MDARVFEKKKNSCRKKISCRNKTWSRAIYKWQFTKKVANRNHAPGFISLT